MNLALLVATLLTLPHALQGLQVHADFSFEWVVDQGTIQFEYTCATGSWCAVGIGQSMMGANTFLCTETTCEEGSTTAMTPPVARTPQSLTGVSFASLGATYTATWTRTLAAPTPQDAAFNPGPTGIIWATGSNAGGVITPHANTTGRGMSNIDTSASSTPATMNPGNPTMNPGNATVNPGGPTMDPGATVNPGNPTPDPGNATV
ncbi:x 4e-06 Uncharacterized protein, partial [Diplonema papillatum]